MSDERSAIRPMAIKEEIVDGLDAAGDVVETGEGEQVIEQEIGMEERGAIGAESENPDMQERGELPAGDDEVLAPRAAQAPSLPSAREIEDHELYHCPARSWCEHCVRGQGKDSPHLQVQGIYADSSVVRVSMDYAFLTEDVKASEGQHQTSEAARTSLTILVMTETLCRSICGYARESKGSSEQ